MNRRLLSQRAAAAYCEMGVRKFRKYVKAGVGPRAFNPHGDDDDKFYVEALDDWMAGRNMLAERDRAVAS